MKKTIADEKRTRDQRIQKILLALCSVTVPTTALLLGYLLLQHRELADARARLLSEAELQTELLAAQPLDRSVIPHIVNEIGFVLNPFMQRSTLHARPGESYPVNRLGLRGPEIRPKEPGVRRILIVGDSLVFGWKLPEDDRLSSILNRYVRSLAPAANVEFLTIALPGWNVRSERAFLDSHLFLLDPDLVLWSSIPNDTEDVAGVVPPGVLAAWASPQARNHTPVVHLSRPNSSYGSFMPSIAERRTENIRLIASFQSTYDIPVVVLGWLAGYSAGEAVPGFDPPWIHVPKVYLRDPRWQIAETDPHPSAWANEVLAIGVLRRLVSIGMLPELRFDGDHAGIAQDFENEAHKQQNQVRKRRQNPDRARLEQIPSSYAMDQDLDDVAVLYGIVRHGQRRGEMSRAGTLFLRAVAQPSRIRIRFAPPSAVERYPGAVSFVVRGRGGEQVRTTVVVDASPIEAVLPLPRLAEEPPVYEISWLFDYLQCSGPNACASARLLSAGFD